MAINSFEPVLSPEFVAEALKLHAQKGSVAARPFTSVVTDSRKIEPGCLFVGIPGEKFDGNTFVNAAIAQGATGVICKRGTPIENPKGVQVYAVGDTLEAFRQLAEAWRHEFSIPVIAIAGSVGKTTTKELLAAILRGKWEQVLKTTGSQNGFVGIPMTLLELRSQHSAAVIEIGIDEIGAMAQHMNLVRPNAAVLTAIGPEHLEKLRDIATVAQEEGIALTSVAQTGGWIAINLDDPWIRPHFTTLRHPKKIGFTFQAGAASTTTLHGALAADGSEIRISGMGMENESFPLPLPGAHNASNCLAAISIARALELTPDEIRMGLRTFQGAEGRSQVKQLRNSVSVICDYYNASPPSVEAALKLLAQIAKTKQPPGKRWACLGDMLELGPDEERFHRELAHSLRELGIEKVLLYGPRMRALADEFANGDPTDAACEVTHFEHQGSLTQALKQGISAGDSVLIKGSRGMKMEEVWKALEAKGTA